MTENASPTCPACSSPMRIRSGSFGKFWGCTSFPTCRKTVKYTEAMAIEASGEAAAIDLEPVDSVPAKNEIPAPSYAEAKAAFETLVARLDPDQRTVYEWRPDEHGNTRVIAAAGSGKTTTSVALLARLVWSSVRNASQIVATTFTSKAGKELAERLGRVLPPGALSAMRVGTFHGLALRALRGQGGWDMTKCLDISKRAAGIPSNAKLWSMVLGYAGDAGIPGTAAEGLGLEEPDVKAYMLAVDVLRSHGLTGDALVAELVEHERESGLPYLARAWGMVRDAKSALGAWDFADALQAYYEHLTHVEAAPGLVVVVDEAQDNSELQINIARLLAAKGALLLVGDVRQSIYSWRGAFPQLFIDADKVIGAKTLQLRNNYRSAQSIVALGNAVADGKDWSIGDAAAAFRQDAGTITVNGYGDPAEEGREVASQIRTATHDGAKLDDFAILTRTNAMSGAFEAALVAAGIPCIVVGGTPFFKRYEVQNALAYVSLSVKDDFEAFARIVNKPRRYLGAKFVQTVKATYDAGDEMTIPVAVDISTSRLGSRQRDAARDLYSFLVELRAAAWPATVDLIVKLLSPVEADDAGEADADRSGLVAAVASIAKGFFSAQAFLDFAAWCAGEVVEAKAIDGGFELPVGRVTISTIHKAKGLEWRQVFVSCSAGNFPHARATGERYHEEERLFYVAATRAKDTLALTYSEEDLRGNDAGPSPFLSYVPGFDPDEDPEGGGEPVEKAPLLTTHDETVYPPAPFEAPSVPVTAPPSAGTRWEEIAQPEPAAAAVTTSPTARVEHGQLVQRPFEGLAGVTAVTPAKLTPAEALFGAEAWLATEREAEHATRMAPAPVGGRYVQPTEDEFKALLAPLGFHRAGREIEVRAHQQVMERRFDVGQAEVAIRVFTTIDLGGDVAREVGEDSIKVAAIFIGVGGTEKPLHKKLPYACRTRGWRTTIVSKIGEVAKSAAVRCPRCGAPMSLRTSKAPGGDRQFYGCIAYPGCNGSRKVEA